MISFKELQEINRHGVPKNATKAELKAIRSNPRSSKGAKQLAHWKLNMHHNESLDDWFNKEKWVRMDTKGNIKGDCAREPGEGKPKCLPKAKAQSMSKDDRAKAARRKRREDPQVDRPGTGNKPINVKTEGVLGEDSEQQSKRKRDRIYYKRTSLNRLRKELIKPEKPDVKTEGLDSDASYEERKKKNKDLYGDRYKETGRHKRDHEAERRRIKKEYGKGSKEYNKHMNEEEKMVSHEYSARMKKHGKMTDEQKAAVTAVYDKGKVDKKMKDDPHVKRAMHYMRTEELNDIFEKCWDGWVKRGMKKKGNRMVPNCVKEDWLKGGIILEASKPNNPKLWSQAKAAARAKYDVYPSAYANGFAVKWYKKRGGTWRGKKD